MSFIQFQGDAMHKVLTFLIVSLTPPPIPMQVHVKRVLIFININHRVCLCGYWINRWESSWIKFYLSMQRSQHENVYGKMNLWTKWQKGETIRNDAWFFFPLRIFSASVEKIFFVSFIRNFIFNVLIFPYIFNFSFKWFEWWIFSSIQICYCFWGILCTLIEFVFIFDLRTCTKHNVKNWNKLNFVCMTTQAKKKIMIE